MYMIVHVNVHDYDIFLKLYTCENEGKVNKSFLV